jgi:hypothetical protein
VVAGVGEPDGEHVDGSFDDDRCPFGGDPVTLLTQPVARLSFVVDRGVGGVEVLRRVGLAVGAARAVNAVGSPPNEPFGEFPRVDL